MRANLLLKHNITTLLRARGQTQRDLAQWCRRTDAWLSQIFSDEKRGVPLKYLDRIADFFGLATYQLLQPGISRLTERRTGMERRAGRDRRIAAMLRGAEAPPPPPHPTADEWKLLAKYRRLTAEERGRLDQAADVLLLSQDGEARTGRSGRSSAGTTPATERPRRARRLTRAAAGNAE